MPLLRPIVLVRCLAAVLIALAFAPWPAPALAADSTWQGEYFSNPVLAGSPALVRSDADVNFDWGWGSPDPSIPIDQFSARWTRKVNFADGAYRFNATVDDGVRLYVDGQTVIDQWHVTAPITYTSSIVNLPAGDHDLKVEYYENTERAQIRVWWEAISGNPAVVPAPVNSGIWHGKYYNNRDLHGDPTFERDDFAVNFDWGVSGPGGGIGGTGFSARWERKINLPGGNYRFIANADDGVRVWYDWTSIIDEWHDSGSQTYIAERFIHGGEHTIVVEYYQRGGTANVEFSLENTDVLWVGNLQTCMRPNDSWIKIYRLTPNFQWHDMKSSGYGPQAADGSLKLFGMPIDASFGYDGQPYKIELWESGRMVASEGDFMAGQPALRMLPSADLRTSWGCGANLPK
jgi:hypothetical protein